MEKLEKRVDDGFAETKTEFRAVRVEIGTVNRSLQSMWLTMIIGFAGLSLAMILGFGGMIVAMLNQT